MGGDEFALLLPACTTASAEGVAKKICDHFAGFRFVHGGHRMALGASIVLAVVDGQWVDPAAVMQAAVACCYSAKQTGRNRVVTFSDDGPRFFSALVPTRTTMCPSPASLRAATLIDSQRGPHPGIKMLAVAHSIEFLRPLRSSAALEAARASLLTQCPAMMEDHCFAPGTAAASAFVRDGSLVRVLRTLNALPAL